MAAALALAFFVIRPDQGADTGAPLALAEQRAELMQSPDVIVAPWATGVAADGYEEVEGDVVWSNSRQAGYMRLSGLVANDASTAPTTKAMSFMFTVLMPIASATLSSSRIAIQARPRRLFSSRHDT